MTNNKQNTALHGWSESPERSGLAGDYPGPSGLPELQRRLTRKLEGGPLLVDLDTALTWLKRKICQRLTLLGAIEGVALALRHAVLQINENSNETD